MTEQKNKPVIANRDRNLSISIFERKTTDEQGKEHTSYGACLQRSYKKQGAEDFTREQINLFPEELLKFAALAVRSYNDVIIYADMNKPKNTGNTYPAQSLDADIDQEMPTDSIPF